MLTALRAKSQVALPKSLIERLGVSTGDKTFTKKGGVICLIHMDNKVNSIWPKEFVDLQGSLDDETFVEPEDILFSEREAF